uniref:Uncharacterized protein n=1 Tax=Trichuris muris TaxID=70415 RepID=A0A5S6Q7K0_TRIMR
MVPLPTCRRALSRRSERWNERCMTIRLENSITFLRNSDGTPFAFSTCRAIAGSSEGNEAQSNGSVPSMNAAAETCAEFAKREAGLHFALLRHLDLSSLGCLSEHCEVSNRLGNRCSLTDKFSYPFLRRLDHY